MLDNDVVLRHVMWMSCFFIIIGVSMMVLAVITPGILPVLVVAAINTGLTMMLERLAQAGIDALRCRGEMEAEHAV